VKNGRWRRACLAALLLGAGAGCGAPTGLGGERPNILFILADDLRWDALGSYGNEGVRTPNLDALAREGLVFDAFYVANPVCSASRASFLSGLYTFQRGVLRPAYRTLLDEGTPTVASLLGAAGYRTGFVGKAHLGGDPRRWGFEEVPFHYPGFHVYDPPEVRTRYYEDGREVVIEGDATQRIADAAIEFIERQRDVRWFLWLATTAPHWPYHSNESHPYRPETIEHPPGYPPGEALALRERWAAYYSSVSTLDEHVGRVLARLDELGLRDDTLVFFTSDNGIMHMSHGIVGKAVWFEEALRQPAILRWPGRVAPGRRAGALVSSVDFVPSVLELAGVEAPDSLEGRSFLPVVDADREVREHVFAESVRSPQDGGGTWQMVRDERFKLVQFTDREEERLYDLDADPHEQRDLAELPEYAEVAERLRARLRRWRQTTQ
jgi:arylsulfatase A-like enzyme